MSKEIKLTQGKVATVDDEDFDELSKHKWFAIYGRGLFYARRKLNYKPVYMHREILGLGSTNKDKRMTDHINHDTLDNRRCNLRICTCSQNQYNRFRNKKFSSSQFKGIHWAENVKGWRGTIQFDSKRIDLGCFKSEIEAAKAYDKAAIKYHGEFARLNFA